MRVHVDESGRQHQAGRVDLDRPLRKLEALGGFLRQHRGHPRALDRDIAT